MSASALTEFKVSLFDEQGPRDDWWSGIELAPGLALTRAPDGYEHSGPFSITHVASGLALGRCFDDPEQAARALIELATVTDWTTQEPPLTADMRTRCLNAVRSAGGEW